MIDKIGWGTIRFRLIGWYALLLVATLILFSVYIFFQFRELEQTQQDNTLQAAATSARSLIDPGRPPDLGRPFTSTLVLRRAFNSIDIISDLNRRNIQVRLFNREGNLVDALGNSVDELPIQEFNPGFATLTTDSKGDWRIYHQLLITPIGIAGAIQVAQPIYTLNTEFSRLFTPILLGTLMALILAVLGGLFLANQALSPIDKVTRTAQSISTHDLAQRIHYHGPKDEIGRLAQTLDQMLERLEHGFEQERRFTSDASHELRTPLTALKGRLEVTLSRARSEQEYRQTLNDLNQEVERLVRLTNSLLYLARLDQAKQASQSEFLNLGDLLESIMDSVQGVAELKEISLISNIPLGLKVHGNFDQLTRLFLNLLDNAIKYTPNGGQIMIEAYQDKQVCIAISDNGQGIATEHLPHLFKRFYRVEADRASTSGGSGLGLAIANEIAQQHQGSLAVKSELGRGTTMLVSLPILQPSLPVPVSSYFLFFIF